MKKIVLLVVVLITHFTKAQTSGCLPLQKGNFTMSDERTGTTYITRTKKYQVEESPKLGIKARYDIKWVTECKYELSNRVVLEGGDGTDDLSTVVVIVEITKVNLRSYNVKVSSNFSDQVFDGVVDIVK